MFIFIYLNALDALKPLFILYIHIFFIIFWLLAVLCSPRLMFFFCIFFDIHIIQYCATKNKKQTRLTHYIIILLTLLFLFYFRTIASYYQTTNQTKLTNKQKKIKRTKINT